MALTYGVTRNINDKKKTQDTSSTWADKLSSIYDTIQNRKPFSYNQQEDPMYRQYQQMYERNAKLAQDNAVGQAAALSGGYANSYAETAGQAMYNQAMNGLNEKALDLANAAQNRYQMETDNLLNQYQIAGQMYSDAYQRERDSVADQRYADEFAYQKQRDSVADSQWQKNYDYQKARDAVSDSRYDAEWNYQKERDRVSDKQNEQSLAYKYATEGYTKDKNGNWVYTGTNDDKRFEQELEYKYKTNGFAKNKNGEWVSASSLEDESNYGTYDLSYDDVLGGHYIIEKGDWNKKKGKNSSYYKEYKNYSQYAKARIEQLYNAHNISAKTAGQLLIAYGIKE